MPLIFAIAAITLPNRTPTLSPERSTDRICERLVPVVAVVVASEPITDTKRFAPATKWVPILSHRDLYC